MVKKPNEPDAANPAIPLLFQAGRQCRGVADPGRCRLRYVHSLAKSTQLRFGASLLLGVMCLAGCGAYHSLPADWHQSLPGVYEGISASFRETVEFKPDGTFHHEVSLAGRTLISESGKWSTSPGRFVVDLDRFTQFYDPVARKFSETGKEFVSYEFGPLPDGKTFSKISASAEFDYTLARKETP